MSQANQSNNKNFSIFLSKLKPHQIAAAVAPKSQQYAQAQKLASLNITRRKRLPLTQQKFDQQRLTHR